MWGTLLKVLLTAVLEWARRLVSDRRAADAERELGRKEQAEVYTKEVADGNAEQAARADENGAIASRPLDRRNNRGRLRDGSA